MPKLPYREPLMASAIEGEVVVMGRDAPIAASFTPEAILGSLAALREAAEEAMRQRDQEQAAVPPSPPA